jgi:hypothetical protein
MVSIILIIDLNIIKVNREFENNFVWWVCIEKRSRSPKTAWRLERCYFTFILKSERFSFPALSLTMTWKL